MFKNIHYTLYQQWDQIIHLLQKQILINKNSNCPTYVDVRLLVWY